ncbi:hypothetical protein KR215_003388, partial [Drosophila sulfurigaster]
PQLLTASNPLTPVSVAQLQGSTFGERTSSSMKSNDKSMILSADGNNTTPVPIDLQKNPSAIMPVSMPTNPVANGFLAGYCAPVSCSAPSAVLSLSGSKGLSVPMTSLPQNTASSSNSIATAAAVVAASAGITKSPFNTGMGPVVGSAVGSSLVFHGGPPPPMPHLGGAGGHPMLIQSTPYRTPYANYSLYAPYNSVAHGHGQYLPSVLPIVAPNTSSASSPHRNSSSREPQPPPPPSGTGAGATSLKAPVTSTTTSQHQQPPQQPQQQQLNVSGISVLRPVTPLGGYVISSSGATTTTAATTTASVPLVNSTHPPHPHPHNLSVYAAGGVFGVSSTTGPAITTTATQLSAPVVTSVDVTQQPQLLPSAPPASQMLSQSGYPSAHHLTPQLLTSYSQFAPPAAPPTQQHQSPSVRCSTTSAMSTGNNNNSNSVVTVQNVMTTMSSTSSINTPIAASSSSSVIQKTLSPKSDSPSRDRDVNYSISSVRPNNTVSMAGAPQGITLGPQFCGLMPSTPISGGASVSSTTALSTATTHSVLAVTGPNIANFSPKTGLWLNSPAMHPSVIPPPCASSVPIVSSGNVRPSPSPLSSGAVVGAPTRVIGNAFSPHASTHSSTVGSGNPSAPGNFQSTFFATPLAPPLSSSITPTSIPMAISSSSVTMLPMVSHTSAVIATITTATTTTSSVTTVGTVQSTVPTVSSAVTPTAHPFSAESLFQPSKNDQADLLRRELDSRFLDRSGLTQPPPPPTSSSTYLRQELHHHQHQHTHLHQHPPHPQMLPTAASMSAAANTILPQTPPTSAQIFPPPLFKDIPKIPAVDPQFYRAGIGLPPGYTGYSPAGLLHSGLGGPTPFMPPNHLTSFAPKKTGRWNAMHVRIAWEIYAHQNKQSSEKLVCSASMVGPSHSSCSSSISVNSGSSGAPGNASNMVGSGGSVSGSGSASNIVTSVANGNVMAAGGPSPAALGMKSSPALALSTASPHLLHRSGELPAAATYARSPFEASPLAASFIGAPPSHIGTAVSPFGRYVGSFGFGGLTHFGRDISVGGHLDAWR